MQFFKSKSPIKVVELFAGVGGFRLGLEKSNFKVIWSNQWEPSTKKQHALMVYEARFGKENHSNEDLRKIVTTNIGQIPTHDLLVGGFPCQDYSIANTSNKAKGMTYPDRLDKPSRTIITTEGGKAPSRIKHVIQTKSGLRRLTPVELERLNMFPDNHTKLDGITDSKRAYLMGNALVVGLVEKIGVELYRQIKR